MKKIAWASLLLLFAPFLRTGSEVFLHGVPDMANSGDAALLELNTRHVFSRGVLLGPYSRFGFSHPGPLYFQLRYPVYELMGRRNSSLLVATVIIQLLSIFFAFHIARKTAGDLSAVLFSASAALFLLTTDKTVWLSEWNPYIVILPFMLYTVSMVAASVGKLKYLSAAAVSGSLAAQTHIAVIPSMLAVFLCSVVVFTYPKLVSGEGSRKLRWKPVLIALGLLFLLWAPPLYQEFFPGEGRGNISEMVKYFENSSPEIPWERALGLWVSMVTPELSGSGGTARVLVALRLVLLAMALLYFRGRKGGAFHGTVALVCIVLHGVSLFSVGQVRGELEQYLVEWIRVVPLLSAFTLLSAAAELAGARHRKLAAAVPGAFIVCAALLLFLRVGDFFRADLHPSYEAEITVRETSLQLQENLDWDGGEFYVMRLASSGTWPQMAGIINMLDKRGFPIGLEVDVLYMPFPPPGVPLRVLRIGYLNETGLSMPGVVAHYGRVGIILE